MANKLPDVPVPDNIDALLYVKGSGGGEAKCCGYRREYLAQNLTQLEEEISICKVCGGIMRKASLVKEEITCQSCSDTPNKLNTVRVAENCVNNLEIKCPLLRDCKWKGKLVEAENHLKKCKMFLVVCSDCKQVVARGAMKSHKQNICPAREVACGFCDGDGKRKDYSQHLKYCLEYPINCLNDCGKNFPRKLLSQHNTECPLFQIECPYTKYGCKAKQMKRRDLLSHKKEFIIEHVDMVESRNHELEVKNQKLEVEIGKLKFELITVKRLDGLKWKLCNANELTNGQIVTSPDFYVNKYHLKCFCKFESSSYGSCHFDFSIQRVRGEYDAHLGVAYVTEYRIILSTNHGTQPFDGNMNYQLKIGTVSKVFYSLHKREYSEYLNPDMSMTIKLYFDVNSSKSSSQDSSTSGFDHNLFYPEYVNPDPFEFKD